jgi:tRNA threonylcarbamoyladenosine biosynthesis protein TsaE
MSAILTHKEKETYAWARNFAQELKGGEIIGLSGELGAGKTVFAKGLASGLGILETVNSPTFVIMKLYSANQASIKQFCHIDAYRLSQASELKAIGSQDYLGQANTVSLIEWPENIRDDFIQFTHSFRLEHQGENTRKIFRLA